MNRILGVSVAAVFLFLLSHTSAYGCSCLPPKGPVEELKRADAVFSGRVISVKQSANNTDPVSSVEVSFSVSKRWKAAIQNEHTVYTSSNSASCGYSFEKDESYLVYAYSDRTGRLTTEICSRTKKLADTSEDLEKLNKAEPSESTTGQTSGNYIEVDDGIRLFYEKVGSGKQTVVVPLHLFLFEDFKHLAKDKTFIFYDVRNRGRSDDVADGSKLTIQHDVEDLEKLRRHFKLEKMSLIGESYVGLMIVMYAMKYPERVDRLIQIGPVPLKYGTTYPNEFTPNDPKPVPDAAESAKIDELYKQDYHKTNPKDFCEKDWAVSRFGLVGDPKNVDKLRSVCHLQNEWPVNLYRHFATHFVSVQKLDIAKEDVAKVTVPVLTIHGTRDRNAVYGAGREWAQLLPNARLLTVKDAAHFPWVDNPKLVFDSINVFLAGRFPSQAEKLSAGKIEKSQ